MESALEFGVCCRLRNILFTARSDISGVWILTQIFFCLAVSGGAGVWESESGSLDLVSRFSYSHRDFESTFPPHAVALEHVVGCVHGMDLQVGRRKSCVCEHKQVPRAQSSISRVDLMSVSVFRVQCSSVSAESFQHMWLARSHALTRPARASVRKWWLCLAHTGLSTQSISISK